MLNYLVVYGFVFSQCYSLVAVVIVEECFFFCEGQDFLFFEFSIEYVRFFCYSLYLYQLLRDFCFGKIEVFVYLRIDYKIFRG